MALKLVTRDGERVDGSDAGERKRQASGRTAEAAHPEAPRRDERQAEKDLQQVEPAPLWDEGIATFLLGEYQRYQRPLTIDDLRSFTVEQAIRISDILETLFLLAIYGQWVCIGDDGRAQVVDAQRLDALYARGRLAHDDLDDYRGEWKPLE